MLLKYQVNISFVAAHKGLGCKWFPSLSRGSISPLRVWVRLKGLVLYLFLRSTCIGMSRDDLYVLHKGLRLLLLQRTPLDAILIQFPIRCFTHPLCNVTPPPPPVRKINFFSRVCLLTPWCRVLLEKLTGLQLVKKFPAFHGTRRFITALTSVRHLSLCQTLQSTAKG